ncbi:MAG TPA: TPM domain-containing protein [Thermoanaerobaculia bacterium]|nr:TPM domain-containing protein [Thermoanaerobaculia bacterium]
MRRRLAWLPLLVAPLVALAAEAPLPAPPARWATDKAGFLSAGALARLDARLESFERTTGDQVLVWIGDTTGQTPIEDWAVRTFAAWKVGRVGLDDGLVVFVLAKDRKVRIEVGYGLEEKVPDAVASRVIREVIAPRLQAGDPDGALDAGIGALLGAIRPDLAGGGLELSPAAPARPAPRFSPLQLVFAGLLAVGFLVLLVTNPGLALYLLVTILSGGRGGGSSGGGGFSGGGGRSGGGGATGGW